MAWLQTREKGFETIAELSFHFGWDGRHLLGPSPLEGCRRFSAAGVINDGVTQQLIEPSRELRVIADVTGALHGFNQAILQDVLRIRDITHAGNKKRFELCALRQQGVRGRFRCRVRWHDGLSAKDDTESATINALGANCGWAPGEPSQPRGL